MRSLDYEKLSVYIAKFLKLQVTEAYFADLSFI